MPRLLILALLVPLSGCAASGVSYPSLLPRQQEGFDFSEPDRPAAAIRPDPALDERIAAMRQSLSDTTQRFDEAAGRAESIVNAAQGAVAGSERWVAAQVALSELDVRRAETGSITTEIERAAIDLAASGQPSYPALDALLVEAQAADAGQRARIARLEQSLPAA